MAAACAAVGARLVHYSTDYVFDGSATAPYREDSPTAPLGVYGASKLAGEEGVRDSGADALILRTAWVYSARGQNFLRTMLRLVRSATSFAWSPTRSARPRPRGSSPTRRWRFSTAAPRQAPSTSSPAAARAGTASPKRSSNARWWPDGSRVLPRVLPIATSDYPTPARRPAYSVLDTARLTAAGVDVPTWDEALRRTFERMGAEGGAPVG